MIGAPGRSLPQNDIALAVALALACGVLIQCVARSVRVPAIILLLGAGVALGPEGLGLVLPQELGDGLFIIVDFAVAVILFEGALNLDLKRLRRAERAIRRLITWGALATFAGGALAARLWMGWSWTLAVLFGSLVVVTGPTVVGPLLRDLRLRPGLRTILEAEGVLIDPIGALLAVLVLQVALAADTIGLGIAAQGRDLALRLVIGTALGAAGGLTIAGLLRLPALVHGLENILTLALVVLLFHLGEHALSPSGLLAVTVAGLVVGNLKSPVDEDLREFKDQMTVLLIGAIFVLLAADIGLDELGGLGPQGVGVLMTLVLVVRPAGVWLATRGTDMSAKERLFVGAIAPRGIVAAAIASLTAGTLASGAIPGGEELRALVFLVIAGTVVAAGVLAWPLATVLDLKLPARDRVAILGAEGLGLALAEELHRAGATVVLIDADPQHCQVAQGKGLFVLFGDGLQERTLRRAPIELVGTVIGATPNDNLNSQFVRMARQTFGVPHGLVLVNSMDGDRPPEHVTAHGADVLFDGPNDETRWDVRSRQGDVEIAQFEFANGNRQIPEGPDAAGAAGDVRQRPFALLTLERNGRVSPMAFSRVPRPGDRAAVAIYLGAKDQALAELAAMGWQPYPDASDPQDDQAAPDPT